MQSEETRELAALIASDIVTNARSESGFDAVVGHDAAKAALEEAVLLPLRHPDLFRQSGLGGSQAGKRSSSVTAHLYTLFLFHHVMSCAHVQGVPGVCILTFF